jgi:hypothetical protein
MRLALASYPAVCAGASCTRALHSDPYLHHFQIVTFVSAIGTVLLAPAHEARADGRPWSRADVDRLGTLVILRQSAAAAAVLGKDASAEAIGATAAAVAADEAAFVSAYNATSADAAAQEALMRVRVGEVVRCRCRKLSCRCVLVIGRPPDNRLRGPRTQAARTLAVPMQEFAGPRPDLTAPPAGLTAAAPPSASSAAPATPAYEGFDGTVYDMHGVELPGVRATEANRSPDVICVRCPHAPTACRMASLIRAVKAAKDSTGGVLTTIVTGVPVGLGEPCFDKLPAVLAHAMLSLPAVKGFELGSGFRGSQTRGSVHNDVFVPTPTAPSSDSSSSPAAAAGDTLLRTTTNHAGGTLGGISSGAPLQFRVAIKPVSTIGRPQATADYSGQATVLEAKGRHDPCVLPRAPPLVEAMTALVLADAALIQRSRGLALRCLPPAEGEAEEEEAGGGY